jgi:hypothetical protein
MKEKYGFGLTLAEYAFAAFIGFVAGATIAWLALTL